MAYAMSDTKEFMRSEATKLSGAKVGIPTRNLQFAPPGDVPRFFAYNGSAVGTALMAVFSAIFPPGERFFVESVRRFRDQIADETLKAKISGFVGQESMHGREHERLNEYFRERGFDLAMPEKMIAFSLGLLEYLPARTQLACTAFMEHFTAELALQWLTHEEFRSQSEPEMLKLWSWHGLEELEHKDVAFDVLQRVSADEHGQRLIALPLVVAAIGPGLFFSWGWLVAREGKIFDLKRNFADLWALFKPGGFITNCLVRLPEFFGQDFHPLQHDTTALVAEWREKLFGETGEALAEFKNRAAVARAG